jgi:hypothetical protein
MSSDENEPGADNQSCTLDQWEELLAETRCQLWTRLNAWKEREAKWRRLRESSAKLRRRKLNMANKQ